MIPLRDANPTRRTPVVTLALIAVCFLAFGWELVVLAQGGEAALTRLALSWGLVPAKLLPALGRGDLATSDVLCVFTSMFLHASWYHILGNMLFLWIFGGNVEDRMGRLPFLLFYLVGGIAAAAGQTLVDVSSNEPMIGASGAISATLGAYVVLYPRARIQSLVFRGFFYQLIAVPAVIVLGFWVLLQAIDGIVALNTSGLSSGVAVYAHLGGFVAGLVLALPFRARRFARRDR